MCIIFQDSRIRRLVINLYVYLKPDAKNATITSTGNSSILALVEIRDS